MELIYKDDCKHIEHGTPKAIYKDKYLQNYKVDLGMLDITKPRLVFWNTYDLGVEFLSIAFPKDEKDQTNPKKYTLNCSSVLFEDILDVNCDCNGYTDIGIITTKSGIRYVVDETTGYYIMSNLCFWERSNLS